MALFFDRDWFAQKLSEQGRNPADFARALNMAEAELAMIWKDQRSFTPPELAQAAQFLGVSQKEVLDRAGRGALQKPPINREDAQISQAQLDEISTRLENIERILADLRHILLAK